ncbi:hypothetical protein NL676_028456 [Syzygium grande]|nr:hypothetical protein NL676_028456 [Syzygium grande]
MATSLELELAAMAATRFGARSGQIRFQAEMAMAANWVWSSTARQAQFSSTLDLQLSSTTALSSKSAERPGWREDEEADCRGLAANDHDGHCAPHQRGATKRRYATRALLHMNRPPSLKTGSALNESPPKSTRDKDRLCSERRKSPPLQQRDHKNPRPSSSPSTPSSSTPRNAGGGGGGPGRDEDGAPRRDLKGAGFLAALAPPLVATLTAAVALPLVTAVAPPLVASLAAAVALPLVAAVAPPSSPRSPPPPLLRLSSPRSSPCLLSVSLQARHFPRSLTLSVLVPLPLCSLCGMTRFCRACPSVVWNLSERMAVLWCYMLDYVSWLVTVEVCRRHASYSCFLFYELES